MMSLHTSRTAPALVASILLGLPVAFEALRPETREQLARQARLVSLAKGEVLIETGMVNPPVFAVRSGLLALSHVQLGDIQTVTDFFMAQDLFVGSMSQDDVAPFEIRSVAPSVVVSWPMEPVMQAFAQNPDFSQWVMRYLVRRQARMHFHRARIACLPLEAQLAFFLWSVSEPARQPGQRLVTARIPQALLASYFGVTREEVSRKKALLEKAGYLHTTPEGLLLTEHLPVVFAMQTDAPAPWESPWPHARQAPRTQALRAQL